jgi:hypothetical protein
MCVKYREDMHAKVTTNNGRKRDRREVLGDLLYAEIFLRLLK